MTAIRKSLFILYGNLHKIIRFNNQILEGIKLYPTYYSFFNRLALNLASTSSYKRSSLKKLSYYNYSETVYSAYKILRIIRKLLSKPPERRANRKKN